MNGSLDEKCTKTCLCSCQNYMLINKLWSRLGKSKIQFRAKTLSLVVTQADAETT